VTARSRISAGQVTAAIVLFAALIRIPTLGSQSYWGDEAITIGLLHKSLGSMLSALPGSESTPPLYYVLAWFWARIFGFGEAGLRSLSFVFGVLTVLVVYRAAQTVGSRRIAVAAGVLASLNPLLVWYSQEARAYSLFILLGSWSFLWFLQALEDPSRRNLAWWSVVSALALTSHYFAVFLVAAEAAWLIVVTRRTREVLAWCIPWVATGIALLPLAYDQRNNASWIFGSGGLVTRFKESAKNLLVGLNPPLSKLTFATAALLALAALALAWRDHERPGRIARISFGTGATAVVLTVLPEAAGLHYVNGRNLSAVLIAFLLPVAIGLGVRPARFGVALAQAAVFAALAGLSLSIVLNMYLDPSYQRENWRLASKMLGPTSVPRAIVGQRRPTRQVLHLYGRDVEELPAGGTAVTRLAIVDASGGGRVAPKVPGFRLTGLRYGKSIVVYLYSAPRPVRVTADQLIGLRPEPTYPSAMAALQLPS
jgi:mannosyltransferase